MKFNPNVKLTIPKRLPGAITTFSGTFIFLALTSLAISLYFIANTFTLLNQPFVPDQPPATLNQRVIEQAANLLNEQTVQFLQE